MKKIGLKRTTVLILVFCILFGVLLQRLFSLQIIHGKEYAENFNLSITKERTLKGIRGIIFDRNGKPLAYNLTLIPLFWKIMELMKPPENEISH